jgi:hypothetical protein
MNQQEYKSWLTRLKPGDMVWRQMPELLTTAQRERQRYSGWEYCRMEVIAFSDELMKSFDLICCQGGGYTAYFSRINGREVNTLFCPLQVSQKACFYFHPQGFAIVPIELLASDDCYVCRKDSLFPLVVEED